MIEPVAPALQHVHQACQRFAQGKGFPRFLFVAHVPAGTSPSAPHISTNYPVAWVETYDTLGFMRVDPVLHWAIGHVDVFGWEMFDKQAPSTRTFWSEASRHDLDRGCSIPKHGPHGAFCMFSLAGQDLPADPGERRRLFEEAATFAAGHFERLLLELRPRAEVERLTQRQHDALELVAKGLTVRSVAERLRLHRRSVEDLLAHACIRLGVRTSAQAVARAVELGEIGPSLPETAFRGSVVLRSSVDTREPPPY